MGQANAVVYSDVNPVVPGPLLLIVDHDRHFAEAVKTAAREMGLRVVGVPDYSAARRLLNEHTVDFLLLDVSPAGGLDFLLTLRERFPELPMAVSTEGATVHTAVEAMRLGAIDFLEKPVSAERIHSILERVRERMRSLTEERSLRQGLKTKSGFGGVIGRSPEMEKLFRIMSKVAGSSHPVLILGESGTGKELVARAIHFSGPRRDKPFLPVDCGALVPTLIESELFGHVKGAFTGANRAKDGLLSIADGGTVFLDEIGELPIDLQSKLLRALQEKEIRPVGGTKSIPIHVRILAATNRDLEFAVQQGTFRKDLFYRLNVVNLRIPPLRERRSDIPLLVAHFLERLNRTNGTERELGVEALRKMSQYDWPGNVRELENCLERAAALSSGPEIHLADLPTQVQNFSRMQMMAAEQDVASVVPLAELEKHAIYAAVEQAKGDKLLAAKLLGIGKTTLYRKLKEYESETLRMAR